MVSVTRERIALIVFALLVLVGIGCLVAYINVGHSWNVTATTIDDVTGELDGYTVVLFQGVVSEEDEAEASPSDEGLESADDLLAPGRAEDGADEPSGGPSSSSVDVASDVALEDGELENLETDGVEDEGSSTARSGGSLPLFSPAGSLNVKEEKPPVDVLEAAASYREKGANVLVLDIDDEGRYAEGTILKRGDRRFGVFSVEFNEPLPSVQAKVDYLKAQSVDFVVAITPDKRFVQKATGIDIAISTKSEGLFFMGETLNGTFYTDSPIVTQVGAVLVSPYNVVSSRDIVEL